MCNPESRTVRSGILSAGCCLCSRRSSFSADVIPDCIPVISFPVPLSPPLLLLLSGSGSHYHLQNVQTGIVGNLSSAICPLHNADKDWPEQVRLQSPGEPPWFLPSSFRLSFAPELPTIFRCITAPICNRCVFSPPSSTVHAIGYRRTP